MYVLGARRHVKSGLHLPRRGMRSAILGQPQAQVVVVAVLAQARGPARGRPFGPRAVHGPELTPPLAVTAYLLVLPRPAWHSVCAEGQILSDKGRRSLSGPEGTPQLPAAPATAGAFTLLS